MLGSEITQTTLEQVNDGVVFNVQHYSLHDGPGIRTNVFLKGCPLRCLWCCNPESINGWPELGFRETLCNGCGRCIELCPQKALSLSGQNTVKIERTACDNCGACVAACAQNALAVYGQRMKLKKVMAEIAKDAPFYRRSGGGVTITGGEPLMQAGFVAGILQECRRLGLHTAIETSGYCSPRVFRDILDETDLVMFDLKVMDDARHLALTGKSNGLILNNARLLAEVKCTVQPRMPLIPGINDSDDNISMVASFLHSLSLASIELMPYHELGKSKYAALGRPYKMNDIASAKPEDAERAGKLFKGYGVECRVSI
ncbi:glycyl-radical enzyme activating protein [Chloroflexota bacterium]